MDVETEGYGRRSRELHLAAGCRSIDERAAAPAPVVAAGASVLTDNALGDDAEVASHLDHRIRANRDAELAVASQCVTIRVDEDTHRVNTAVDRERDALLVAAALRRDAVAAAAFAAGARAGLGLRDCDAAEDVALDTDVEVGLTSLPGCRVLSKVYIGVLRAGGNIFVKQLCNGVPVVEVTVDCEAGAILLRVGRLLGRRSGVSYGEWSGVKRDYRICQVYVASTVAGLPQDTCVVAIVHAKIEERCLRLNRCAGSACIKAGQHSEAIPVVAVTAVVEGVEHRGPDGLRLPVNLDDVVCTHARQCVAGRRIIIAVDEDAQCMPALRREYRFGSRRQERHVDCVSLD